MTDGTAQSNIWTELDAWAGALKPWQKFILEKAVASRTLSEADVEVAYDLLLQEYGLREAPKGSKSTGSAAIGRPAHALTKPLHLHRIGGLRAVNAIPDGTELHFGPQLSVIYGPNGAGKSGFARLIANGCFSRSKPEILTNVYEKSKERSGSADFHVSIDGKEQPPIKVTEGSKHEDLLRIAFFDVNVARQHVSESAPFEFKPAGFDVFAEMGRVFQELAKRLAADVKARTRETNFPASFIGAATEVSKAVAAIGPKTLMTDLEKMGTYGAAEAARLEAVNTQIDTLKRTSPKELLASLHQTLEDVDALSKKLDSAGYFCEEEAVRRLAKIVQDAKEAKAVAETIGSDQFRRPFFKAVGSPEWQAFAQSAHALAKREGAEYPTAEDRCLLCERPFEEQSRAHVSALLNYVAGDAQKRASLAAKQLDDEIKRIATLDAAIFAEDSRARENILKVDAAVAKSFISLAEALLTQKSAALVSLREGGVPPAPLPLSDAKAMLSALREQISNDVERLQKDGADKAIEALALEHQTLRHRNVLNQLLPEIRKHVADLKWCVEAAKARTSLNTRPITEKETELVGRVFGEAYGKKLAQECEALKCDMPIELKTVGQKGQTVRSLSIGNEHPPELVLSEGEQKAVALADFLTEVGLNPASAGIVLDDPVTSQDHDRKQLIAARLVAEAAKRQVIVFTHDLPFLNDIVVQGEAAGLDVSKHWVQRQNGKPGYVARDDAPTTSKTYDTTHRAKEFLARARKAGGTEQQDLLEAGMSALRRTIEETVVKRLLKGVVPRWSDRIIVTKLREVQWDDAACDELVDMFEELSRYIRAHSHSDEAVGTPMEIKDLETRIERVDALIKACTPQRPKQKLGAKAVPA